MAGNRGDNSGGNRPRKAVDPRLISRSAREELERKKLLKERARKKLRRRRAVAAFIILLIVLFGMGIGSIISFITGIKTDNLIGAVTPTNGEAINILLLGMDIGDAEQEENEALRRTDTIMVVNYNPDTKKINVVSIPRDTLIEVEAYDEYGDLIPYWKINSAYALGGEEEVVTHVESLLDITVNYIVEVNYKAFRDFIDAIGGIEMYIEQDMYYDDDAQDLHINFTKGDTVLLDGKKAEEFFRWRKNNDGTGLENGDLDRIQNQQKFIAKVVDKVLSPTIIFKVPKILDSIQSNIATNMPSSKMISLGLKFMGNKGLSMSTLQGYEETIYGQSFLVVDKDYNRDLINSLKSGEISQVSPARSEYSILVLNGTRISGLAGSIKGDMQNIGYEKIDIDNAQKRSESVIISNDKDLKERLKLDLGITNFEKNNKDQEYQQYDAVVILGEDFSTFGE